MTDETVGLSRTLLQTGDMILQTSPDDTRRIAESYRMRSCWLPRFPWMTVTRGHGSRHALNGPTFIRLQMTLPV